MIYKLAINRSLLVGVIAIDLVPMKFLMNE